MSLLPLGLLVRWMNSFNAKCLFPFLSLFLCTQQTFSHISSCPDSTPICLYLTVAEIKHTAMLMSSGSRVLPQNFTLLPLSIHFPTFLDHCSTFLPNTSLHCHSGMMTLTALTLKRPRDKFHKLPSSACPLQYIQAVLLPSEVRPHSGKRSALSFKYITPAISPHHTISFVLC